MISSTGSGLSQGIASGAVHRDDAGVWDEPYLETCCRAALHRLTLSGCIGRPAGLKDGACLARLAGMGLAAQRGDGRYGITEAGARRHAREVLKRPEQE